MAQQERFDKDWDDIARHAGYLNERLMLEDMYVTQNLSMKEIGHRFGCSSHAVMHHLQKFGIDRRSRGGHNNNGHQTRKLFRFDQRIVLFYDLRQTSVLTGVSQSSIWKYRRMFKEDLEWSSVYCPRSTTSSSQSSQPPTCV